MQLWEPWLAVLSCWPRCSRATRNWFSCVIGMLLGPSHNHSSRHQNLIRPCITSLFHGAMCCVSRLPSACIINALQIVVNSLCQVYENVSPFSLDAANELPCQICRHPTSHPQTATLIANLVQIVSATPATSFFVRQLIAHLCVLDASEVLPPQQFPAVLDTTDTLYIRVSPRSLHLQMMRSRALRKTFSLLCFIGIARHSSSPFHSKQKLTFGYSRVDSLPPCFQESACGHTCSCLPSRPVSSPISCISKSSLCLQI